MSHFKSLIWKRAWHGNHHAEQAKPCSGDVVCAWCACQAILKSGQDRLTLQASLSHCESVKGLDNRQTDADNWQPGRQRDKKAREQTGGSHCKCAAGQHKTLTSTQGRGGGGGGANNWSQATGKRQHGQEMTETLSRTVKSVVSVFLLASHQHVLSAKHKHNNGVCVCVCNHRAPWATVIQFRKQATQSLF